ncbi:MAG TPA: hypothetical protein VJ752_16205 [Burkholderiaceae bacterium]|nr:hypothetical protein [Burkholderiaceae bacterium]
MSLKDLLKRLVFLLVLTALLAIGQTILHKNVSNIAERLFAPSYIPIADNEALAAGRSAFEERVAENARKREKWKDCAANTDEYLVGSLCQYLVAENIESQDEAKWVSVGHEIHRNLFLWNEVRPHEAKAENLINWIFGILYFSLVLFVLLGFKRWLTSSVVPRIRKRLEGIDVTRIGGVFRGMNARRKLRKAESDFITAKNLYENGLITEEMFLMRKNKLKHLLGHNALFRNLD